MDINKNKDIKVRFIGGSSTGVTGSAILVEYPKGKNRIGKFLIEYGLIQSNSLVKDYELNNRKIKGFKAKDLDFIICSHLHGDHTLLIGKLYKEGARCPLIFPEGSRDFYSHMCMDSASIMLRDSLLLSKIKKKPIEPIYSKEDADIALDCLVEYSFYKIHKINDYVSIQYIPAGHIEFSAQIIIYIKKNNGQVIKIGYSGDLGNKKFDKVFSNNFNPIKQCDVFIGEATYNTPDKSCTTKDRKKDREKIKSIIDKTCILNKNKVLFAVFSLDRCQHMLYEIYRLYKDDKNFNIDIYVDSPLSVKLTETYVNSYKKEDIDKYKLIKDICSWKNVKFIKEAVDSKTLINSDKPMIVLASSAFLKAGRAVKWVQNLLPSVKAHIVFCGYSGGVGSIVWKIKNYKEEKIISIDGKKVKNKASITFLKSFSSHMQYEDLIEYYSNINTKKICIVHSNSNKDTFCNNLRESISKNNRTTKVVCVNKDTLIRL